MSEPENYANTRRDTLGRPLYREGQIDDFKAGICPDCGVRFGASGRDETHLRKVQGTDPKVLAAIGPYVELFGPCGHLVITSARR